MPSSLNYWGVPMAVPEHEPCAARESRDQGYQSPLQPQAQPALCIVVLGLAISAPAISLPAPRNLLVPGSPLVGQVAFVSFLGSRALVSCDLGRESEHVAIEHDLL